MSNEAADAQLDAWIASLRKLPKVMAAAAPDLAKDVKEELVKTISAGEAPNGDTWEPKKDGGKPLVNAADALQVTASGTTITATIGSPESFHHYGTKRLPKRQILPQGGLIPPNLAAAFTAGLVKKFRKAVG